MVVRGISPHTEGVVVERGKLRSIAEVSRMHMLGYWHDTLTHLCKHRDTLLAPQEMCTLFCVIPDENRAWQRAESTENKQRQEEQRTKATRATQWRLKR